MKNNTTWRAGRAPGAGRRTGSRNKLRREVRTVMLKLERAGDLDAAKCFRRLQEIALGSDLRSAVAASKVLLSYRFGLPVSTLELDVEHSVEPVSVMALLEEIAQRPEHRARVEERERRRLAAAIDITKEGTPS